MTILKKKGVSFLLSAMLVIGALFGLAACGGDADPDRPSGAEDLTQEVITVNYANVDYEVLTNPTKVAVLDLGILDIFSEIGLDNLGITKANLGIPGGSFPEYISEFKAANGYTQVSSSVASWDTDSMILFDPQLIIISGRLNASAGAMKEACPDAHVIYLALQSDDQLGSLYSQMDVLGKIFTSSKVDTELSRMRTSLESRVAEVKATIAANPTERAMIMMYGVGGSSASVHGAGGRFSFVFSLGVMEAATSAATGFDFTSTHGGSVSFEFIAQWNPSIIILVDRNGAIGAGTTAAQNYYDDFTSGTAIKDTLAYKNDKITIATPSVWYLSWGGYNGFNVVLDEVEAVYLGGTGYKS